MFYKTYVMYYPSFELNPNDANPQPNKHSRKMYDVH